MAPASLDYAMLDSPTKSVRCAIYTRKSSDEGLEQEFNSLDAQRESCEAYIRSQQHEGWITLPALYDDGGFSGGSMDRPALKQLLEDVKAGAINTIVVYKVDRLTRSLMDFAKIVEILDKHGASFVSVTQQFNTTTSMGRLTLNVLLSFAQFEREVTAERIRDKIAQSKAKGMWTGGCVPLGYDAVDKKLVINGNEAEIIRLIFERYLELGCVQKLQADLDARGLKTKQRIHKTGRMTGGGPFSRSALYQILRNRIYIGEIAHRGKLYPAQHDEIVGREVWEKVQASLAESATTRTFRASAESPALLAGIIYDDAGNRMTSTHSNKKGVRYRYYTSQAVLQNKRHKTGALIRIPARDIEVAVLDDLKLLLADTESLTRELGQTKVAEALLSGPQAAAITLSSESPADTKRALLTAVRRIDVGPTTIAIQYSLTGMESLLCGAPENHAPAPSDTCNSDTFVRQIKLTVRKTGRGTKLVLSAERTHPKVSEPFVSALVRARTWLDELLSGKVGSIEEIARREGLKQRYTARIVRLAFLSPELVELVLSGRQPLILELEGVMYGFPMRWDAQKTALAATAL
jgi:DNA invertase Pin-like site-specific DNA recombinase